MKFEQFTSLALLAVGAASKAMTGVNIGGWMSSNLGSHPLSSTAGSARQDLRVSQLTPGLSASSLAQNWATKSCGRTGMPG